MIRKRELDRRQNLRLNANAYSYAPRIPGFSRRRCGAAKSF